MSRDGIQIERSRHAQQFVIVGNAEARDGRLSFRARGLHHYLLSLPSGWRTTTTQLAEDNPEGRDAIRTALNELVKLRYVTREKRQDARGRWSTVMTVHDKPQPETDFQASVPPARTSAEDGFPVVGDPGVGKPGAIQKTEPKTVNENGQDQKMASRRGRASGAAARTLTDEDKIDGTRFAIAAVYGETLNQTITDEEALALYKAKAPASGKVRSVAAYMTKIFEDTPDLDTHLAGLDYDGESDDYDQAREMRQAVINGDSLERWHGACARCNGTNAVIDPASGICVWCVEELRPDGGEGWNRAILNTVIVQLKARTGYQADDAWAARVAGHIIGDAPKDKPVRNPAAYIRKTIEDDPHPERFTPTYTPGVAA